MPLSTAARAHAGDAKARLDQVNAELAQLRDQRQAEQRSRENSEQIAAGNPDSAAAKAAQYAAVRVGKLDSQIEAAQAEQQRLLQQLSGNGNAGFTPGSDGGGWNVDAILGNEQALEHLAQYAGSSKQRGTFAIGEMIDRNALAAGLGAMAAAVGGTDAMRRGDFAGIGSRSPAA